MHRRGLATVNALEGEELKGGLRGRNTIRHSLYLGRITKTGKGAFSNSLAPAQGLNRVPPDVMLIARYEFGLQAKK